MPGGFAEASAMRSLKTGGKIGGNPRHAGHIFNGARGPGRPKGSPNKLTRDVREMLAAFAERKANDFEKWIERTAVTDPAKAATLYLAAIEYHIPRLQRTELRVAPAAFTGDPRVVEDPAQAAQEWQRIVRGEIAPGSVTFKSLPKPAPATPPAPAGPEST